MYPNRWAKAIGELLERSGSSQAEIAKELGVTRAIVNRFLTGQRTPKPKMVMAINRAIAKVLAPAKTTQRNLIDYLDSVANSENESMPVYDDTVDGALHALRSMAGYLQSEKLDDLWRRIAALSKKESLRVITALNHSFRRRLISDVIFDEPPAKLSDFKSAFRGSSINIDDYLKPASELEVEICEDEFFRAVRATVAQTSCDNDQRWKLQKRLLIAHSECKSAAFRDFLKIDRKSE